MKFIEKPLWAPLVAPRQNLADPIESIRQGRGHRRSPIQGKSNHFFSIGFIPQESGGRGRSIKNGHVVILALPRLALWR